MEKAKANKEAVKLKEARSQVAAQVSVKATAAAKLPDPLVLDSATLLPVSKVDSLPTAIK